MTRPSLARVLGAATSSEPVGAWQQATALVGAERVAIERLLDTDPAVAIYGFTTLLGQLDGVPQSSDDARTLLAAHLIGTGYSISGDALRLVAACKAEQLHHGGSGIHPDSFGAVVGAATSTGPDAVGAWDASYGSADVVPGSWWVASLRERGLIDVDRRGDLIALINGTFFSTAAAIAAGAALVESGARVLAAASRFAQRSAEAASTATGAKRQLPISSRDLTPVIEGLATALGTLGEAIERRLERASANPLFEVAARSGADDAVTVRSQNGFLDYPVTFALTGLTQATLLAAAVTQRLIATTASEHTRGTRPDPSFVQHPKVAQARLEALLLDAGSLPSRFAGAESEGIEDLRDLSLLTALRARRFVDTLDELVDLLESVELRGAAPWDADPSGQREHWEEVLANAFVGTPASADQLSWAATLRLGR